MSMPQVANTQLWNMSHRVMQATSHETKCRQAISIVTRRGLLQEDVPEEQTAAFRGYLWRSAAAAVGHLRARARLSRDDVAAQVGYQFCKLAFLAMMHVAQTSGLRNGFEGLMLSSTATRCGFDAGSVCQQSEFIEHISHIRCRSQRWRLSEPRRRPRRPPGLVLRPSAGRPQQQQRQPRCPVVLHTREGGVAYSAVRLLIPKERCFNCSGQSVGVVDFSELVLLHCRQLRRRRRCHPRWRLAWVTMTIGTCRQSRRSLMNRMTLRSSHGRRRPPPCAAATAARFASHCATPAQ